MVGKKTRNLMIGAAALAAVAAIGTVAYFLAIKKKVENAVIACKAGAIYKNVITLGTGQSSLSIDKAGKIVTFTFGKGYTFKLVDRIAPVMELPACLTPVNNVALLLKDDEYTTQGVPDGTTGMSWLFRFYPVADRTLPMKLFLYSSPANADGTRTTAHFYGPPSDGVLTLTKDLNMIFYI